MKTIHENGYIVIPNKVASDNDLTSNAKLLCGIVNSFSKKDPRVFASNGYYADFLGISKGTASKAISKLVDKGYLYREIEYHDNSKEVKKRFLWITDILKHSVEDIKNYWASDEGKENYSEFVKGLKSIWED